MSTQTTQPVVVYPASMTVQPPPPSSHSNGSFGAVFIVLAVIVVVSGIACFLGRFWNRRSVVQAKAKPHKHHHQNSNFRPKERERDIEFGFEPSKRITAVRPLGNGEPRGLRVQENGGVKGETAPAPVDAGEQLKAGA